MPNVHLVKKKIYGHTYWYARETQRVDGKPKTIWQKYLGKAEDILHTLQNGGTPAPVPQRAKLFEFGAISALLSIAQQIDLVEIINRHLPPQGGGPTPGEYLLWASLNRAVAPTSKRGFASWWNGTILKRLFPTVKEKDLSSQRFWDLFAALSPKTIQAIETDLSRTMLSQYDLDVEQLIYDTTNFFTFIDTFNHRNQTAQRGRNKQKRTDLRQVGLALMVTREDHIPLFHQPYAGNLNDVTSFSNVLPDLLMRAHKLGLDEDQITLIYDKGNNSALNQHEVDDSRLHFVGALTPSDHPDLLCVPRDEAHYHSFQESRLEGVSAYRTKKTVLGNTRTVVVTFSESFYQKQADTIQLQITKTTKKLRTYQHQLQKWHQKKRPKGKRPALTSAKKQVAQILAPQYMKQLFQLTWKEVEGIPMFHYRFDRTCLDALHQTRLGKTILFTDQHTWSTKQIILAYRGQSQIEDAFKIMKDPHWVCVWPFFHWTDQKIYVHLFCCVLTLTLSSLLYRQVRKAGLNLSFEEMMTQLHQIRQVLVISNQNSVSGRKKKTSKVDVVLSEMNPIQKSLYETLELDTYFVSQEHALDA